MAWKVRPFGALGTPGLGLTNPIGTVGTDGMRKVTTHHFGFEPDGAIALNFPYLHRGGGRVAVRCESSGEYFPESRIRRQWDGKMVGDIYLKRKPRHLPGSG